MTIKLKQAFGLVATSVLLAGCLNNLDTEVSNADVIGPNEVVVQTTNNRLGHEYQAVITDGRYQLSAAASADNYLSSSGNAAAFEQGLVAISQSVFPTNQYLLREGQLIDAATLTSWISRESELYPDGLNPALPVQEQPVAESASSESSESSSESSSASSDTNTQVVLEGASTPIYLAQIMEKDLMIETANGYELSGIVIGLAMNSEYQYTDANGVTTKQEISIGEMRERGKAYATTIVGRLRNTEALRNIPIVVGIFRQAPSNDIVGGTYLIDGVSREGNAITDWTEHNESRIALPVLNSAEATDRYQYFYEFRNQVSNFFPNLNGITGEAFYVDGALSKLNIKIVTQFYQQTEITALTQHALDVAQNQFPANIPVEIKIESGLGIEAVISRAANSESYQSYVFE
ncbi:MAG: CamS family sex pheromone protein [Aerococcaceae bacterium]|nr:CamS family sex pheromone protein [Aerococcaceae bacterium]